MNLLKTQLQESTMIFLRAFQTSVQGSYEHDQFCRFPATLLFSYQVIQHVAPYPLLQETVLHVAASGCQQHHTSE